MKQIHYIIDLKAKEFHFFESYLKAKEKQEELTQKYGYRKGLKTGISEYLDKLMEKLPHYEIHTKKMKNYYGTVWYAFNFTKLGACHYIIEGRWKDIKFYKEEGLTIKKRVLVSYDEFNKLYDESEQASEQEIQDMKNMLEGKDLSKLEE